MYLRERRHNIIYSLQVSLLRVPRNVFTFYVVRDLRGESNYEMKPRNVFSFHASIFPVMRTLPPATGTEGQITPSPRPAPPPPALSLAVMAAARRAATGEVTSVGYGQFDKECQLQLGRILVCLTR